ncbi:helix-turn-helix domain-containing protein [Kribbella sp. NPDC048928]|uniref:helix-turn-helix domain-containing protein n=1 Tax=Kribbella sp. NPDC048928 TaxID=3364111 RepID=UPI00371803BD
MHPWIENVTLRPAATPVTILPPDPAATVVWRMTPAGESDVLVAGPRTTASYHATKELPVCVRLRIRPGTLPLAGEILDRTVPLEDLCGPSARVLAEQLVTCRDRPEEAVELVGDFLLNRLPLRLAGRLELVDHAVADLRTRRVDETAARLGVSERYLRRVFRQTVGVSPKHFARIARVRSVIGEERNSWAETAAYAGYADQSHLIADFRSLMHVTPKAYAAGNVPLSTC